MSNLFLEPLTFEKVAEAGKVGESSDSWPQEVQDLFFEQHPELADAEIVPSLRDVNEEKGFAIGLIHVTKKPNAVPRDVDTKNVTREVRFPFVIREREVSPFDVFVVGETFHPATEKNIDKALFRPDMFDIVRTMPGDTSLVGDLYPPYRSRYGFGTSFESGAGGKFSSIQIFDEILPTLSQTDIDRISNALSEDPSLKAAVLASPARAILSKVAMAETMTAEEMRDVRRQSIKPNVLQFVKVGRKVRVKFANSDMFAPQETMMTIKEAAEMLPAPVRQRLISNGDATISTDPVVRDSFEENKASILDTHGVYHLHRAGQDKCDSYSDRAVVYTSVVDFDMTDLPVTVAIFFSGEWAMQDTISGMGTTDERLPEFIKEAPEVLGFLQRPSGGPDDEGHGATPVSPMPIHRDSDHHSYGKVDKSLVMPKLGTVIFVKDQVCTLPIQLVTMRVTNDGTVILRGTTSLDKTIELYPTRGIKKIEKIGENKYALPSDLKVVPLGRLVKIKRQPDEYVKVSSAAVEIISDGNLFTFRGNKNLIKLAGEAVMLGHRDALFLAASMGMSVPFAEEMLKKAARDGSALIHGVRPIITEAEKIASVLSNDIIPALKPIANVKDLLLKEAAVLPDEDTADKVLSLNFITPENVSVYAKNLPIFINTATKMAELLMAIRVGYKDIPEAAVKKSMSSIQGVIEALQQAKFNQPKT